MVHTVQLQGAQNFATWHRTLPASATASATAIACHFQLPLSLYLPQPAPEPVDRALTGPRSSSIAHCGIAFNAAGTCLSTFLRVPIHGWC